MLDIWKPSIGSSLSQYQLVLSSPSLLTQEGRGGGGHRTGMKWKPENDLCCGQLLNRGIMWNTSPQFKFHTLTTVQGRSKDVAHSQAFPLSSFFLTPPFLHTASNQKLDGGKVWERS